MAKKYSYKWHGKEDKKQAKDEADMKEIKDEMEREMKELYNDAM